MASKPPAASREEEVHLTEQPLDGVIQVMNRTHGLDVSAYKASFLRQSIAKRSIAAGCRTFAAYLDLLAKRYSEAEALQRSLRISYSEFFRDPLTFALLEHSILPGLVPNTDEAERAAPRIWSAGCAEGQEAWSVAILLDALAAARGSQATGRVFATDLSATDIDLARAGRYSAAAVGNVRLRHLDAYFSRQGDLYVIAERLRERVDFAVYDLLDEATTSPPSSIFGDFDIALCCNVLLYYRPEMQSLILKKLRRCLKSRGYLVTGESERQIVEATGVFRAVMPRVPVFQAAQRRDNP